MATHVACIADKISGFIQCEWVSQRRLAASTSQCVFRNVDQIVCRCRSGAGSIPLAFNTLARVVSVM